MLSQALCLNCCFSLYAWTEKGLIPTTSIIGFFINIGVRSIKFHVYTFYSIAYFPSNFTCKLKYSNVLLLSLCVRKNCIFSGLKSQNSKRFIYPTPNTILLNPILKSWTKLNMRIQITINEEWQYEDCTNERRTVIIYVFTKEVVG